MFERMGMVKLMTIKDKLSHRKHENRKDLVSIWGATNSCKYCHSLNLCANCTCKIKTKTIILSLIIIKGYSKHDFYSEKSYIINCSFLNVSDFNFSYVTSFFYGEKDVKQYKKFGELETKHFLEEDTQDIE